MAWWNLSANYWLWYNPTTSCSGETWEYFSVWLVLLISTHRCPCSEKSHCHLQIKVDTVNVEGRPCNCKAKRSRNIGWGTVLVHWTRKQHNIWICYLLQELSAVGSLLQESLAPWSNNSASRFISFGSSCIGFVTLTPLHGHCCLSDKNRR
jgi:hypothetical protein